jgi:Holliday junction DNA helicase RuvA
MFAYIKGKIAEKNPAYVVIDVVGIGYWINISLNTFSSIEKLDEALLYVHHIQREDVQALYGFFTKEEKEYFGHLLSVSGVGPNTARMVLSSMKTDEIRRAIITQDVPAFKKVKGVGPKTAQRILIDLKDKIDLVEEKIVLSSGGLNNTAFEEALSALIALGFPRVKASAALSKLRQTESEDITSEYLIKAALKSMS